MARLLVPLDPTRTGRNAEGLEAGLRRLLVGQDDAIEAIVSAYQTFVAGMNAPGRPVANFLFLGPTGSGKTRAVEATAEALLGNPRAVIKIDCAEFQHSHEIAKLVGSPPGYLGHRETHPVLSQETLNQHHTEKVKLSFVLFDEIEKASDALWNLLLGILDKGTLTLGDNRRVDFSQAMIFMTSNLGAAEMSALISPRLGFATAVPAQDNVASKIAVAGADAARRKFTPEFYNRLDKVVVFKPLGEPELRRILTIEIGLIQDRILRAGAKPFACSLSDAAKEYVLRQGTDPRYGARPLKRALERLVVQPLSNLIATDQVRAGDRVLVDYNPHSGRLEFFQEPREEAALPAAA